MLQESNRTEEFKEAVKARAQSFPPSKTRPRPLPANTDNWTIQAEQVATNLRSFSTFLASVRRAYLDLGSASSHHSSQPRTVDAAKGLAAWEGVKWLSDKERDEIDLGVKIALRRSVDRVRELEAAELARIQVEARQNPNHSLTRLLGLPVPSSSNTASTNLASHRSCITHYLNSLLAHVSQHQKDQQEARVMRQLEKSATLGGLGGGGALGMDEVGKGWAEKAKLDGALGKLDKIGEVPSIYRPVPLPSSVYSKGQDDDDEPMDEPSFLSDEITPEQLQQFEAEATLLLSSTQTDLESLKNAESSLLEISALQSQLAIHLTQQAELTDQLWEDAVGVAGKVEEGNVQLRKARERNRESRVWLLIFLVGASCSLVFLDYYS